MKSLHLAAALAACAAAPALAVDVTVSAEGGNATSGHQYGFLHEVNALPLSPTSRPLR